MGGIFLENSIKPIEIDDDYADILKIKEHMQQLQVLYTMNMICSFIRERYLNF